MGTQSCHRSEGRVKRIVQGHVQIESIKTRLVSLFISVVRVGFKSTTGSSRLMHLVCGRPLWQPTMQGPILPSRRLGRGDVLPLVFRRREE